MRRFVLRTLGVLDVTLGARARRARAEAASPEPRDAAPQRCQHPYPVHPEAIPAADAECIALEKRGGARRLPFSLGTVPVLP